MLRRFAVLFVLLAFPSIAPAPVRAQATAPDWKALEDETLRHFQAILRLDTSNPPGNEGVVVTNVDADGIAAEHGFKTGDVILEVGGKKVESPAEVREVLSGIHKDGKRSVLLRVKSGEGTKFVALRLAKA